MSHKSKFWYQTWGLQDWKLDMQAWGTRDFQGEVTQGMGQYRACGENKEIRSGWGIGSCTFVIYPMEIKSLTTRIETQEILLVKKKNPDNNLHDHQQGNG